MESKFHSVVNNLKYYTEKLDWLLTDIKITTDLINDIENEKEKGIYLPYELTYQKNNLKAIEENMKTSVAGIISEYNDYLILKKENKQ